MDLLFLVCWTSLFLTVVFWVWKKLISPIRLYVLMLLNLFFLVGLFYLYPMVIGMFGSP